MTEINLYLLRADALEQTPEFTFQHPLNPNPEIYLWDLGAKGRP